MRKLDPSNIRTERELQVALKSLEGRWKVAHSIADSRKRGKEILRLRGEVKHMLDVFKRVSRSTNFNGNNDNLWNKMIKSAASWLGVIEGKYKDV